MIRSDSRGVVAVEAAGSSEVASRNTMNTMHDDDVANGDDAEEVDGDIEVVDDDDMLVDDGGDGGTREEVAWLHASGDNRVRVEAVKTTNESQASASWEEHKMRKKRMDANVMHKDVVVDDGACSAEVEEEACDDDAVVVVVVARGVGEDHRNCTRHRC